LSIVLIAAVSSVLLISGFLYLNRPQLVTIEAAIPDTFPTDHFSHDAFETLLQSYVDSAGNIDYARWHGHVDHRQALDGYLAAVARFSPESAPERFPKQPDALAYWLYAYNAYVIRSVLEHWPLESVTDVRAPIEAVKGLGFFYRQRFLFGGDALSLYAVEHDKILSTYRDPRVHFVLNCASASCPVLRPKLPTGDDLEALLISATREFINDTRNVHIDYEDRQIVLSTIFRWYRSDFVNDLRRRGLPTENGVLGYFAEAAMPALASELEGAAGYRTVFEDYDWAINQQDY
jgi:hypothetical protein